MNLKEIINQFLHTYVAFMTTGTFLLKTHITDYRLLLVGFILGLAVEIYQYFFQDDRELKLYDRILDVSFYIIGSFLMWVL